MPFTVFTIVFLTVLGIGPLSVGSMQPSAPVPGVLSG